MFVKYPHGVIHVDITIRGDERERKEKEINNFF